MKKTLLTLGIGVIATILQAQTPLFPPGKIAVFKAGTSDNSWPIVTARQQPCFVQVFDPVLSNSTPQLSVPLATNGNGTVWINAHAGSEGNGFSRTVSRQFLALEGYTSPIYGPNGTKPSNNTTVQRGIVTMDAFGNTNTVYSDLNNWFGMASGVTQNNPTGIASTDGINFWGTGNTAGTSVEAPGILFFNNNVDSQPQEMENYIQAAAEARIIGGTLYVVVEPATGIPGGIYNFVGTSSSGYGGQVINLPYDPSNIPLYQQVVATNLFVGWGSTFTHIAAFDMNPSATIAYGADQTFGIVKFINNAGTWQPAPYYFNATNLGTLNYLGTTNSQVAANQGIFGICVDWSGTNPVIYATTMENGCPLAQGGFVNALAGHQNQNRLIRIVDTGVNPGASIVAQTLAIATTTNEFFGGLDFTPDLRPEITNEPSDYSTTNRGSATFTVGADSLYPLGYFWLQNGTNIINGANSLVTVAGQSTPTLALSNLHTNLTGYTYQCVVSNAYGMVTSAPPVSLTVTFAAVAPIITSPTAHITNYVGNNMFFSAVNVDGTQPFTYQWYFGNIKLADDGVYYSGSTTAQLTISNLITSDSGNYYLVVSNTVGGVSNLVDVLAVQYQLPVIGSSGQPQPATTFVGIPVSLAVTPSGGTLPQTTQWYKQGVGALNDGSGQYTGSQDNSLNMLTINNPQLTDSGNFYVVISNGGGSVTSQVAQVTVELQPAPSYVAYSNQVYTQNFDSLPDPGTSSVNSINNPQYPGNINGKAYSLANPFDFAYPVITSGYLGGLGLGNTMSGWYGAADTLFAGVSGLVRFAAQNGDQSTGGIIDFGPNDVNGGVLGTNRALGLLATGTTGSTTYALRLINNSTNTLNYMNIKFLGELWRMGIVTTTRAMSFGYTVDTQTNSFALSAQSIENATGIGTLGFSFPSTNSTAGAVDPSLFQSSLSVTNQQILGGWQPGTALWLIWSANFDGNGSGNGYAIDNLTFQSTVNPYVAATSPLQLGGLTYVPGTGTGKGFGFAFSNVPGATFTVYYTPSLTAPINWQPIGSPTEVSSGSFKFTDTNSTNKTGFYKVISN